MLTLTRAILEMRPTIELLFKGWMIPFASSLTFVGKRDAEAGRLMF
jgi:hypothetical protein